MGSINIQITIGWTSMMQIGNPKRKKKVKPSKVKLNTGRKREGEGNNKQKF